MERTPMPEREGTVLHELQMLERQLDRLLPSLEQLNSRISRLEADVTNIKEQCKEHHLNNNSEKIAVLKTELSGKLAILEKDIQAADTSLTTFKEDFKTFKTGLETAQVETKKSWASKAWDLLQLIIAAALGALASAYFK
jgi:chromosome segregation ATPase